MEYKGKQYGEVTDGSARIGDLIHVTEVESEVCDIWCFTTDLCINNPDIDVELLNGWDTLNVDTDVFTRYRYVKDVEETPVKFKSGDKVKVIGPVFYVRGNFEGCIGLVEGKPFCGDYKVRFADGTVGYFPPTSLEFIKSYTIGQLKAYDDFQKLTDELKAIGPLANKVGVTPTNIVPKKVLKSPLTKVGEASRKVQEAVIRSYDKGKTDNVNSPSHYTQTKYEAIDIIEDVTQKYQLNVQYHIGNAIKYLIRAPFKNNTVEDLKKAVWYINRAVKSLEGVE